jgi:hypothetical protein
MQNRADTTKRVIHFSGGVAVMEGFASRFAPEYGGNSKYCKAESPRWESCIDERGLGI